MSSMWSIRGQTGKTVNASAHTLEALQALGADLEFQAMAVDSLRWTIWLKSSGQTATLVPDLGQTLTLYRQGRRVFTGTVTKRRIRFSGGGIAVEMAAEGPWWDLKQIFLSSEVPDQSTETSERTSFVFPSGSPKLAIETLVARAIELGAPISIGSVATCFDIPRLSLRNIAFSEAFAEIMRWVADGHLYFDYTGPDGIYPALCMQRRTPATLRTLTPSAGCVPNIDISPRLDLHVEEIKVMYARRETVDNKRVTLWQSYSAGTASNATRRQPVLTSGPELDTWLPPDFTDSVHVETANLAGNLGAVFQQYDERIKASGVTGLTIAPYNVVNHQNQSYNLPAITTQITDSEGNAIPAKYTQYLTAGQPKDWWVKDGIDHITARITGTLFGGHESWGLYDPTPDVPAWAEALGATPYMWLTLPPAGVLVNNRVYAFTSSVSVTLVPPWGLGSTVIRAEDYAFVNPPEDLAENLLETQNWLPYEGTVTYIAETIQDEHMVGCVLNIAGLLPETANMLAMISGHSTELATGKTTLTLGAPGRFTYRDLVNRFRQSGADNIVWLNAITSGDAEENTGGIVVQDYPENTIAFQNKALTYSAVPITFTP